MYALLRTFVKKYNSKLFNIIKFIIAGIISVALSFVIYSRSIDKLWLELAEVLVATIFMVIFSVGVSSINKIIEKKKLKVLEVSSLVVTLACSFSLFTHLKVFGITFFSLASVILLMFACYKKKNKFAFIVSLFIGILMLFVGESAPILLLLCLMCGIVTGLLSRVGKLGLLIGIVFTAIYSIFFTPTDNQILDKMGIDSAIIQDYYSFLKKNGQEVDDDGQQEIQNQIEKMKNSPILVFFREMLIGFIILFVLPEAIGDKISDLSGEEGLSYEEIMDRVFRNKIYRLNPGEEQPEVKNDVNLENSDKEKLVVEEVKTVNGPKIQKKSGKVSKSKNKKTPKAPKINR